MAFEFINLDELARQLGRDRRDLEKLANRGRLPGRKVSGEWRFNRMEITHWLEQELRDYSPDELESLEEAHQPEDVNADTALSSLLSLETVAVPLDARTKRSVLETLIEVAGSTWKIWEPAAVLKAVNDREDAMSTGFPNGVAIPHPRNPLPEAIGEHVIAFGRTLSGIPFGSGGRALTDLFFLVLCRDSATHLHILARLGRMIQDDGFLAALRECEDSQSAYETICAADQELGAG